MRGQRYFDVGRCRSISTYIEIGNGVELKFWANVRLTHSPQPAQLPSMNDPGSDEEAAEFEIESLTPEINDPVLLEMVVNDVLDAAHDRINDWIAYPTEGR